MVAFAQPKSRSYSSGIASSSGRPRPRMSGPPEADQPKAENPYPRLSPARLGLRFYSPALGRWISRDPIGARGGLNVYAMARNNVVNLVDARGLSFYSWVGEHCCKDKCSTDGEIKDIEVSFQIIPSGYNPEATASAPTLLGNVELLFALVQSAGTAIGVGSSGGATLGLSSATLESLAAQFNVPAATIGQMALYMQQQASATFSGVEILTKLKYARCSYVSCLVFWNRLDWLDVETQWEPCELPASDAAAITEEGYPNTYEDSADAIADVPRCIQKHIASVGGTAD